MQPLTMTDGGRPTTEKDISVHPVIQKRSSVVDLRWQAPARGRSLRRRKNSTGYWFCWNSTFGPSLLTR